MIYGDNGPGDDGGTPHKKKIRKKNINEDDDFSGPQESAEEPESEEEGDPEDPNNLISKGQRKAFIGKKKFIPVTQPKEDMRKFRKVSKILLWKKTLSDPTAPMLSESQRCFWKRKIARSFVAKSTLSNIL